MGVLKVKLMNVKQHKVNVYGDETILALTGDSNLKLYFQESCYEMREASTKP